MSLHKHTIVKVPKRTTEYYKWEEEPTPITDNFDFNKEVTVPLLFLVNTAWSVCL